MFKQPSNTVEILPVLSRGKHRKAHKGACFMEFASYLAGERWSDHPDCTHPLLASLARHVNDLVSDESRQQLVEHVPDVIGLVGSDLRIDLAITLRAARTALPVAAEERQRVMAVAVLNCERLNAELVGRPDAPMSRASREALRRAPAAALWARKHAREMSISKRLFRRQTAPAIVDLAVLGIAQACVDDPDRMLIDLLVGAIDDCRALCRPADHEPAPARAPRLLAREPS